MQSPAVVIWVEGKADERFISDFLNHLNLPLIEDGIRLLDGSVDKLPQIAPVLLDLKIQGMTNLVVLDANSDFNRRCAEVEKTKAALDFDDYFLLPNHRVAGCFETLLEDIAVGKHREIFQCFDDYEKCIKDKPLKYNTPNLKARIYAYCEALQAETHHAKRDYRNSAHWDLDSPALDPLKNFLRKYLS